MRTLLAAGALAFALHGGANAVALGADEIAAACGDADGLAHCGRRIEEIQMRRLPNLATRDGDTLHVTLFPAGRVSFTDTPDADGGRSYALWDYLDPINTAVLYVTHGEDVSFLLLQRANGRTVDLPASPSLAPDRQHLATADFCAEHCRNEIAVWRVDRDGVRKEQTWAPGERWSDASARWKSADTLVIEYARDPDAPQRQLERSLSEPGWARVARP